jgi:hypothetical protein
VSSKSSLDFDFMDVIAVVALVIAFDALGNISIILALLGCWMKWVL